MGGELVLLKHDDRVGPGWLLDRVVAQCKFFRVILIRHIDDLPPPNECNGVVFTSHTLDPTLIASKDPMIREELIFVRTLIGLGVPFLGIDGGAQLLARCMFGDVHETRTTTIGRGLWTLTDEAKDDPLLGPESALDELPVTWWPTHSVTLPPKAVLLGGTPAAPNAFCIGHWTYGLLPHFEATPLMFRDWLEMLPDDAELPATRGDLSAEIESQQEAQRQLAFRVMDRFIERTNSFCHWEPPEIAPDEPLPHE